MTKNVLPITAGVFGSLALAISASADFTGWQLELKGTYDTYGAFGGPNVGLVDVWNLYALFNDPNDVLTGIFVLADSPNFGEMIHSSDLKTPFDGLGGGFWNWASGANTPLSNGPTYNLDPAAADADTYLTIGLKSGTFDVDWAFFAPGSADILQNSGILNGSGVINELFAYSATPDDAQTYPVDGRVLVLQVAVRSGEHASGVWNISWGNIGAGGGGLARLEWTTVPAPGAMALLGLAGLAGTRRRRRG
ncbi:MAG: PEP-CTERM sorting domain-containing protein [Planctomycetes bacterium]|nr:PEP-CTERM sorting domain-containing protein [Planctomycetota bacterium]